MRGNAKSQFVLVTCAGIALAMVSAPAQSQSVQDFYSKNALTILVGTSAGGSFDLMGRMTGRHIVKYIPGKPSVIVKNMPGGGSLLATNHLNNLAPQDGSVLGAVVPGIILTALFKDKNARYDPTKMQWIGNAMDAVPVPSLIRTDASPTPPKSIAELKAKGAIMGAGGAASMDNTNALVMNALIGTKIKVVTGYKGGKAINLAIERGEVQGRAGQAWAALKAIRPDWLEQGKVVPLVQLGLKPIDDPLLKNVPLLIDLAETESARAMARVYSSVAVLGRPMVMGPGVPKDRVEAIRAAYAAMVKDPAFIADAKKHRVDPAFMSGAEIQQIVTDIFALDPKLTEQLRKIIQKKKKKS